MFMKLRQEKLADVFKTSLNTGTPASSRLSIAKKREQIKTASTHIMYPFSGPQHNKHKHTYYVLFSGLQHTKTQQTQARISCICLVGHSTPKHNKHKHTYYVSV